MRIDGWLGTELGGAAKRAAELERLGYDGAFTAEGPHEPFLPLAMAATHSRRLQLMTNIAVAFARSPLDLAQTANDLQLASSGRFILGVGSQIRPHIENRFSMPWSRPAARMNELVRAIKAIQACWQEGAALRFEGEFYRHTLMTPFFNAGPNPFGPPPIFVAALGPRMTSVAAEVGDGLLIHPFHSRHFVRKHSAPSVAAGLARSGRDRSNFTLAATVILATGSDSAEMARAHAGVRRLLGFYGSTPAYRVVLDAHGWGDLQVDLNRMSKQGRWDDMASIIPEEVVEALVVQGSPDMIASAIEERYGALVDRVSFSTPYEISNDTIEAVVAGFKKQSA